MTRFQFHKGTIKTLSGDAMPDIKAIFQFHKGTIKTFLVFLQSNSRTNFNSIKVRLKLPARFELATLSLFQFHKGTIKTSYLPTFFPMTRQFQFHKGTIKTSSWRFTAAQ